MFIRTRQRSRHVPDCVFRRVSPAADSGQALVELALSMPLLVVILLGAAEFGRLAYAAIQVANAAKAGVQYAAHSRANAVNLTSIRSAATTEASDVTLATPGVTYTCLCSNGTSCSAGTCSTGNVEQVVTVTTQATFDPLIHVPGLPTSYTIHGSASQKVTNQ